MKDTPSSPSDALNAVADIIDPAPWYTLLKDRFGIPPETFAGFLVVRPNKKHIALVPDDHAPPRQLEAVTMGLFFLKTNLKFPKLKTGAAQLFGHAATRNVVQMDRAQAEAYLGQQDVYVSEAQAAHCTGRGYVLVRHEELTLGVGFYEPTEQRVRSLFPKVWAGVIGQRML